MKQPIQPLITDEHGVIRFQKNAIVEYLLDHGGINVNQLLIVGSGERFSNDDWEQFLQLIGYSHSGSADWEQMSDETWQAAWTMYETGKTEAEARIEHLEGLVETTREHLKEIVPVLFGIHPDDLEN